MIRWKHFARVFWMSLNDATRRVNKQQRIIEQLTKTLLAEQKLTERYLDERDHARAYAVKWFLTNVFPHADLGFYKGEVHRRFITTLRYYGGDDPEIKDDDDVTDYT